ncbi:MAG TPA: Uma2 family endonuclease [Rubrivivax sp.]|nr:Uma2 family endonuclease [Rubrivivax sp.]
MICSKGGQRPLYRRYAAAMPPLYCLGPEPSVRRCSMPTAPVQDPVLGAAELGALWRQLAEDPDSPDHFELTEFGEIVVAPKPTNRHQLVVAQVAAELNLRLPSGLALYEVAIHTRIGVRVPDLAWLPHERARELLTQTPLHAAPPLVAEVLSPGNRPAEVARKVNAYLAAGSQEVIVVALDGTVVHRADGPHAASGMGAVLTLSPELFRHGTRQK